MESNNITLVLGASENPERYSNKAIKMLRKHHHHVMAVGAKAGMVDDVVIGTEMPVTTPEGLGIHTVTLYLNPFHQQHYYHALVLLSPQRVIFNPGTENEELVQLLQAKDVECIEACTLVMLSTGTY